MADQEGKNHIYPHGRCGILIGKPMKIPPSLPLSADIGMMTPHTNRRDELSQGML
jgi:hypothetical protein